MGKVYFNEGSVGKSYRTYSFTDVCLHIPVCVCECSILLQGCKCVVPEPSLEDIAQCGCVACGLSTRPFSGGCASRIWTQFGVPREFGPNSQGTTIRY